jgi:hypothetical protein
MTATEATPETPLDLEAELREALNDLAAGIRRSDKIREACERMDRRREANLLKFGVQDIAVALIRETRGY